MEVDEAYTGGKRKSIFKSKRENLIGQGPVGNKGVVSAKERGTEQVAIRAASRTDKRTLQEFVDEHAGDGLQVYTDPVAYEEMPFDHAAVNHSAKGGRPEGCPCQRDRIVLVAVQAQLSRHVSQD